MRSPRLRWKEFLRELKAEWQRNKIDTTAGALTFFGVLALFPFLLFAVALASLIIDPVTAGTLIDQIHRLIPGPVAEILGDRIRALTEGRSPTLLTLSAIGAIWAASGGVSALMEALNIAYDAADHRSFLKRRLIAILVTVAGAVLSVVATAIAVATPAVAARLPSAIGTAILWARVPVSAVIVMAILALLYYLLPDVKQRFKLITPGAVVAVILWVVASLGFSFYVSRFGSYDVLYGALGGVIVLLLWMWISAMAVLLGAEINAVLERRGRVTS